MAKAKKGPGSPRITPHSTDPGKWYQCTTLKPYNDTKEEEVAALRPPLPNNGSNPFKEPYNFNQKEGDRLKDQAERKSKRREEVMENYDQNYNATKAKFFDRTKFSSPVEANSSTEDHEKREKFYRRIYKVSSLVLARRREEEEDDKDVIYALLSSI